MPREEQPSNSDVNRLRLTTRLSLTAYDALTEIQRSHRLETGRSVPRWRIIDTAIKNYAKGKGIKTKE
jgi:hypothetical protein